MFHPRQSSPAQQSPAAAFSRRLGLWQGAIAIAGSELALTYPDSGLRGALFLFGLTALWMSLVSQWRDASGASRLPRKSLPVLLIVVGAGEVARMVFELRGSSLELSALLLLRSLCLVLVWFIQLPVCLRSLGGACACLILFSTCLADSRLGIILLLLYSIIAGIWLLSLYWGDVERDLPMQSSERLPWGVIGSGWGIVLIAVVMLTAGRDVSRQVLAELVGSSGGTGLQDERARSGVNDGDNLVDAQENASTTGFSDSNVFLDTNERTLYDAADDRYGGDVRKNQERQRAINIGSSENVRKEQQATQSLQRQKEFGMRREGKNRGSHKNDRPDEQIDALFCVHGAVPVHFRTNIFSDLQEDSLLETIPHRDDNSLIPDFGGWLKIRIPEYQTPGGFVRHQIRIANLNARQIMVPNGLRSFRMGLVNREDFFNLTDLGVLFLEDGLVPSGTTVETISFVPDWQKLNEIHFPDIPAYSLPRYYHSLVAADVAPLWKSTAQEWVGEIPRGWQQIACIRDRLRSDYQLSQNSSGPDPNVTGGLLTEFLTTGRSGPDYLFAAAAAALFRELKYPCRIVGGFYANPRKYEPEDGHVYVRNDDLHFWVEVCLPDGMWVTVEPSPGYEVLGPQPDWYELAWSLFARLGTTLIRFWQEIAAVVALAALVWSLRFVLLDRLMTLWWICKSTNSLESCIEGTWSLLQYRARWSGLGRHEFETVSQFLERLDPAADEIQKLHEFRSRLESWMYLPPTRFRQLSENGEFETRFLCRQMIATWTLKRLRRLRIETLNTLHYPKSRGNERTVSDPRPLPLDQGFAL